MITLLLADWYDDGDDAKQMQESACTMSSAQSGGYPPPDSSLHVHLNTSACLPNLSHQTPVPKTGDTKENQNDSFQWKKKKSI